MNNLALTYSQLLKSGTNLRSRCFGISSSIKTFMNSIENGGFLSVGFLDQLEQYPKYPHFFPVINDLKDYNLMKIYNITSDDTKYLLDAIYDTYVKGLKKKYDKMPERDILLDVCLQNSYFADADDLFKKDFLSNLYRDKTINNYVYDCYDGEIDSTMRESSMIYLTVLDMICRKNLPIMIDGYQRTIDYILQTNTANKTMIMNNFSSFIDDNSLDFTKGLIKFILRYCYGISYFSDTFLDGIYNQISDTILGIKTTFNTYMSAKEDPLYDFVSSMMDTLYGYVSLDRVKTIYKNENIIDQVYLNLMKENLEQTRFNEIYERHNQPTAKQYLLLNYYYKFWPKRFLNVIQMTYYEYVNTYLKPASITAFTPIELTAQIKSVMNLINWDLLHNELNTTITKEYLATTFEKKFISGFAGQYQFTKMLDDFLDPIEGSVFDTYLNSIFDGIFNYLKSTGQISHTFDFYTNRNIAIVYIKTFLRNGLYSYGLVEETTTSVSTSLVRTKSDCYTVTGVWLESDTLHTGTNYYTGGSIVLNEITLGTVLPTNNTQVRVQYKVKSLFVDYLEELKTQTKYVLNNNITININRSKLESQSQQFLDTDNSMMITFIENVYNAALSKKLIFENLSYFTA